ncbi:GPI mannosyltransferase [Cynara cardunculus var. scolymus]|uniref:GPI mannosyltransferase n=1 Tax=Cynara cardunculus var. scolymus TaxID=59895 RepID=A0A103PZX5_CYNCS|nr:GPI mannosyltransferase [Cynara cardunculus var. scolymus]
MAKYVRPLLIGLILCVSHSRTFSIINGYAAPLEIYKHFEHHYDAGSGAVVCVGSEWHRFPSSFFIPDYVSEVRWIDRGLLPFPFNSTLGGTSAAPPYFNNKNKASPDQFVVAALPYLDRELSPPLHRSFFIPYVWEEKNIFGIYKLLKRHKGQQ